MNAVANHDRIPRDWLRKQVWLPAFENPGLYVPVRVRLAGKAVIACRRPRKAPRWRPGTSPLMAV
jgi:hypothetical protein